MLPSASSAADCGRPAGPLAVDCSSAVEPLSRSGGGCRCGRERASQLWIHVAGGPSEYPVSAAETLPRSEAVLIRLILLSFGGYSNRAGTVASSSIPLPSAHDALQRSLFSLLNADCSTQ